VNFYSYNAEQINIFDIMEHKKQPVERYYYSEDEWNRLGCGPLPPERDLAQQRENVLARGNPPTDGKAIKGYN
jgi:hypothetical protein